MARTRTPRAGRPVFIVDGSRSPFLKAEGKPGPFTAADIAVAAAKPLLLRQPFAADSFDEVILGCGGPGPDEANIGRIVALRLGCGEHTPAWTVQRNCASGLQALDSAFRNIANGYGDMVLAGGVESMTHHPLLWKPEMVAWLADWNKAKTIGQRAKALSKLRPANLAPVIGLLRGLTDPVVGLSMGQTAENLAHRFGISRDEMDRYAVQSHERLVKAQEEGYLQELETIYDTKGKGYDSDTGVRPGSSPEKLAKLRPVFDRRFGNITAGNSAQITDGGSWVILASENAVKDHNLEPIGQVIDAEWAGVDPAQMGLGPVHAVVPLLKRRRLGMDKIDCWELNEAFAAQVLACVAAWKDPAYCKEEFGLRSAFGELPEERLNVDGGGISIGHPVGATGARIVIHLLHALRRRKAKQGVATLCIGGGQGGAMLIENLAA